MRKSLGEIIRIPKKHEKGFGEKYIIKNISIFCSYLGSVAKENRDPDMLVEVDPNTNIGSVKKFASDPEIDKHISSGVLCL